jgi:hypothetical protein
VSERRPWAQKVDEAARDALARGLTGSELGSELLSVFEARARARSPHELVRQWERDGFVEPGRVDQRTTVALDQELFAAVPAFEALELSPLAPLGVCSSVALASQNKVVSALRSTEVVSDPTNVLALECATRLRKDPSLVLRLATSHRVVRAQALPPRSGFTQHFRLFCLAIAGRERKDHAFVVEALGEHLEALLGILEQLSGKGYLFPDLRVRILATPERAALAERIAATVHGVPVERAVLTQRYYAGLRFMIFVRTPGGDDVPLCDGGAFDWLEKLASNRRLVFTASALGSQLVAYLLREAASK